MSLAGRIRRSRRVIALALAVVSLLTMAFIISQPDMAKKLGSTLTESSRTRSAAYFDRTLDSVGIPTDTDHLIMVPCHGVWKQPRKLSTKLPGLAFSDWVAGPFLEGKTDILLKHITEGVRRASEDPSALLLFSGGQTKRSAGPVAEGTSYFLLAEALGLDTSQTAVEEYARDSYENLLFSIARFRELTGRYPVKITVVGYEFKRARFEQLHRKAVGFDADKFEYVGIDPVWGDDESPDAGELEHAFLPFQRDPHGCVETVLLQKKKERNPWRRQHPYAHTAPEMKQLLLACNSR
ncbi:hypothetical protein CKK34_5154 [Yarrowia sp. E02]|nr:hypothetical protein CKK34_5154 [Yarrowia sp. E02]